MGKTKATGIAGGLFWTFGERIGAQLMTTLVAMLLARLLAPSYYGVISIVMIFINLCNIFVTGGLGTAVVRKPDADSQDFNTAFVLSFGLSVVMYLLLFVCAPYISRFYGIASLTLVMRVMGLRLLLTALNSIQRASIQREMAFRRLFVGSLAGTILSGAAGILAALCGWGVWALVLQNLANTAVNTMVLFFIGSWRPKLQCSVQKARYILSFGSKVLGASLIANLEHDLCGLMVGKVFGSAELAFYDYGSKYPSLLVDNVNSSINSVMLPAYAKVQDDPEKLLRMLRRSVRIGLFLLGPMLIGFMAVADNFVLAILTEKWMPCVPFIRIFCLAYLTRPLETCCHKILLAIGHEEVPLRVIAAVNLVAAVSVLAAVFAFHSIFLVAASRLLVTLVSLIGFMSASNRYVGYRFHQQMEDILPTLGVSGLMGCAAYLAGGILQAPLASLLLQIAVGAASYLVLSFVFNRRIFLGIWEMVRTRQVSLDPAEEEVRR